MGFMKTIEIDEKYGTRWGFAFLKTDSRLNQEERDYLFAEAIKCYLDEQKTRKVKGERFEGKIYNRKKMGCFGSFSGYRFSAEIDANFGRVKLEFLVTEYINPSWN